MKYWNAHGENPGCTLTVRFHKHVQREAEQCRRIEEALNDIWENEVIVIQTLSFIIRGRANRFLKHALK